MEQGYEAAQKYLADLVDPNYSDASDTPLLSLAISQAKFPVFAKLLARGADPNAESHDGSVLNDAINYVDDPRFGRLLVQYGAGADISELGEDELAFLKLPRKAVRTAAKRVLSLPHDEP